MVVIAPIPGITPSMVMHYQICDLQPRPFSDSLFTKRLTNMNKVRECATQYMAIEENKLNSLLRACHAAHMGFPS